jgi:predicted esterase
MSLSPFLALAAALFASAGRPPQSVHGEWGVAYAPSDAAGRRPAILYLHGMWASPEDSCPTFEPAVAPFGFLVCPRGNARIPGPGDYKMWAGTYATVAPRLREALAATDALAQRSGAALERSGGTVVGFSNGAYFAAEVAMAEPGRWTGLVLISMKLDLNAARLRASGVARVVLAAGDRDESRASMEAAAAALDGSGLPARFMSLGPVGHAFPSDMGRRMCDAIAWVNGAVCTIGSDP